MVESRSNQILRTVRSHIGRAREGIELLEAGRSLAEMTTQIEGPADEFLKERRLSFIESMENKKQSELEFVLNNIELQIKRRENTPEVGTSELHWMRNIVTGLMEAL